LCGQKVTFFIDEDMKYILTILGAVFTMWAHGQADITAQVGEAIRKGDAAGLSALFMPQADVEVPGAEGSLNRVQSREALAKFFAQYPPKSFVVKHQGTSKLDDQYRIGELVTAKGTFRVTFFFKKSGNSLFIRQFKVESGASE
jgi:hypothetical protein